MIRVLEWVAVAIGALAVLGIVRRASETLRWVRSRYRSRSVVEASGIQFFRLMTDVLGDLNAVSTGGFVPLDESAPVFAEVAVALKTITGRGSSQKKLMRAPFLFPAYGSALLDRLDQACDLVTGGAGRGGAALQAKMWLHKAGIALMRLRIASLPRGDQERRACADYLVTARADVSRALQLDASARAMVTASELLGGLVIGGHGPRVVRYDIVLGLQAGAQAVALFSAAVFMLRFTPWWLIGAVPFFVLGSRTRVVRTAFFIVVAVVATWLSHWWWLGAVPLALYGAVHVWVAYEARQFTCPVCGGLSTVTRFKDRQACDFCGAES